MKKILTILLLTLSITGFSQPLDYNNLDLNLLDSLILVEVNERRTEAGKTIVYYSDVIHEGVSKIQTQILVNEQKVYHPENDHLYENIFSELEKECNDVYGVDFQYPYVPRGRQTEVSIMITEQYQLNTYQELSEYFVDRWFTSPPHKDYMLRFGSFVKFTCGAVSIQQGRYEDLKTLYGTFQMVQPNDDFLEKYEGLSYSEQVKIFSRKN